MDKKFIPMAKFQAKTKFDITELLIKLSKMVSKLDKESRKISIEKICKGTPHASLVAYHNDLSIDILTKINLYTKVLTTLEFCSENISVEQNTTIVKDSLNKDD